MCYAAYDLFCSSRINYSVSAKVRPYFTRYPLRDFFDFFLFCLYVNFFRVCSLCNKLLTPSILGFILDITKNIRL